VSHVALNSAGLLVLAAKIPADEWYALKANYVLEDFRMVCCPSPAVPKTSPNGVPFFAHYQNECTTAPETKWHREGKALIVAYLAILGVEAKEEVMSESRAVCMEGRYLFRGRRTSDRDRITEILSALGRISETSAAVC
jgi:competence protein CoiA